MLQINELAPIDVGLDARTARRVPRLLKLSNTDAKSHLFTLLLNFSFECLCVLRSIKCCLDHFKLFETSFVPASNLVVLSNCEAELQLCVFFIRVQLLSLVTPLVLLLGIHFHHHFNFLVGTGKIALCCLSPIF